MPHPTGIGGSFLFDTVRIISDGKGMRGGIWSLCHFG